MKIKIDKEKCVGCEACAGACEEVFELGEDGKARIKKNADMKANCIETAVKGCVPGAISVKK